MFVLSYDFAFNLMFKVMFMLFTECQCSITCEVITNSGRLLTFHHKNYINVTIRDKVRKLTYLGELLPFEDK